MGPADSAGDAPKGKNTVNRVPPDAWQSAGWVQKRHRDILPGQRSESLGI